VARHNINPHCRYSGIYIIVYSILEYFMTVYLNVLANFGKFSKKAVLSEQILEPIERSVPVRTFSPDPPNPCPNIFTDSCHRPPHLFSGVLRVRAGRVEGGVGTWRDGCPKCVTHATRRNVTGPVGRSVHHLPIGRQIPSVRSHGKSGKRITCYAREVRVW
jgi:hypothetical protein